MHRSDAKCATKAFPIGYLLDLHKNQHVDRWFTAYMWTMIIGTIKSDFIFGTQSKIQDRPFAVEASGKHINFNRTVRLTNDMPRIIIAIPDWNATSVKRHSRLDHFWRFFHNFTLKFNSKDNIVTFVFFFIFRNMKRAIRDTKRTLVNFAAIFFRFINLYQRTWDAIIDRRRETSCWIEKVLEYFEMKQRLIFVMNVYFERCNFFNPHFFVK